MEIKKIAVNLIVGRLDRVTDDCYDGDVEPVIVEPRGDGKYDLIDGYHRLQGMIQTGHAAVTAIIPSDAEMDLCDFDGGEKERDWTDWIQDQARAQ